jgi:hypothetical protein
VTRVCATLSLSDIPWRWRGFVAQVTNLEVPTLTTDSGEKNYKIISNETSSNKIVPMVIADVCPLCICGYD